MGQAKRRGTFEQRLAQGLEMRKKIMEHRNLCFTKPLEPQPAHIPRQQYARRVALVVSLAMVAGLAIHQTPQPKYE